MDTVFFLAANSGRGFYSLYDGFPERRGVFLSIIKGGPGHGQIRLHAPHIRRGEAVRA